MSLDEETLKQTLSRLTTEELERRTRGLLEHAVELSNWLNKARELYDRRVGQLTGCGALPLKNAMSPGNLAQAYLHTYEAAQIAQKVLAQRLIDQALADMTGFDSVEDAVGSLINPDLWEAPDAAA